MSVLVRTPASSRKKPVTLNAKYPQRLQLYAAAPQLELSIEEFETFALDRLQGTDCPIPGFGCLPHTHTQTRTVLKTIETCKVRNKKDDDLRRAVDEAQDKYLPLHFNSAVQHNLDQERQKDHISHFILRLAYCRTYRIFFKI